MRGKMRIIGVSITVAFLFLGLVSQVASADILEEVFNRTAFVNMEKVFQEYEKKNVLEKKLEEKTQKVRGELEQMRVELKDMKQEYEKQAPLLTDKAKQERQQQINEKMEKVQSFQQQISNQIQNTQNQYTQEILQDIMKKIEEIAKKEGYIYVFDKAALIYGAPTQDITEKIITQLNQQYQKGENE